MNDQIIIDELNRKFYEFREIEKPKYTERVFAINKAPQMVSTLIGARRSGKSFLLYQIIEDALGKKEIPDYNHVCVVDFDNPVFSFMQPHQLGIIPVQFMKLSNITTINTPILFLFDEIQKINGWEQFVIELSRNSKWKVFVTGSSSRMLRGDISASLRGKAVSTEVYPFSFVELLNHTKTERISRTAPAIAAIMRQFDDYLKWGGFPVIPQLDERMRSIILKEYFDTMLLKDIIERNNVSKPQQCIFLMRFLLSNISKPFTMGSAYNAVKNTGLPTSKDAIADYVEWARDAFICYTIPVFSGSIKEQNRNYMKLYAVDWALSAYNNMVWDGMHSRSLENMIFIELIRRNKKVNYFLTREKRQEIDFVVSDKNGKVEQLLQVSWSLENINVWNREIEPLIKSMEYFGLKESLVITMNESDEINTGKGFIRIVPAWKWLLE